jgi:hypothetical protein
MAKQLKKLLQSANWNVLYNFSFQKWFYSSVPSKWINYTVTQKCHVLHNQGTITKQFELNFTQGKKNREYGKVIFIHTQKTITMDSYLWI